MSDSEPNFNIKQLPKEQLYAACLLLGFVLFMIWDQWFWWGDKEDYSFGYLVPVFVGYVLYDRWELIKNYLLKGRSPDGSSEGASKLERFTPLISAVAIAAFVSGLVLYSIGALLRSVTGPQNPASLAIAAGFVPIALSTLFLFSSKSADGREVPLSNRLAFVALFLFPVLIWLISAPLVSVVEKKILVFLQSKVTFVVFNSLDLLGFEIQQKGYSLFFRGDESQEVGVEEACSGIRSLTACIFAGSFFAAIFLETWKKKVLLVLSAMGLAVLTNLMRSMFLTLWAYYNGVQAIDDHWHLPLIGDIGSVHDVTGMAILVLTCIGLLCLLPVFNFKLSDHIDHDFFDDEEEDDLKGEVPVRGEKQEAS